MIDQLYQLTKMILNNPARGNVSPSDFDRAVNFGIDKIYDEYMFEVNQAVNRSNRGLTGTGFENLPDRIREKVNYFLTDSAALVYAAPYFALPADLGWTDAIYYNTTTEVEICKNSKEFRAIQNYIQSSPTAQYPICLRQGNNIRVLPATIITGITTTYLRKPLTAKWTYLIVSNTPVFNINALDYQDIDLHPGEFYRLAVLVLSYFGVNLAENDIVNFAMTLENQEAQEPNTL